MIRPLLYHGIRTDLLWSPGAAIVDSQSINDLLDFKVICCIFPWNNSIYVIGCNCRLGRVFRVFIKCRPSGALSSCCLGWLRHTRAGKQSFGKSYDLWFQSVTGVFSCDQAALQMVFSVCPSVTPFWLCSHHRIIMKFSGVITNDQSKVHAKDQG